MRCVRGAFEMMRERARAASGLRVLPGVGEAGGESSTALAIVPRVFQPAPGVLQGWRHAPTSSQGGGGVARAVNGGLAGQPVTRHKPPRGGSGDDV